MERDADARGRAESRAHGGRPLWLRVVVQVILGGLLGVIAPLLALALSPLSRPTLQWALGAGVRKTGMLALIQLGGALPYLLAGAIAVVVTWLIARKPWDAMGAVALEAAVVVTFGVTCRPSSDAAMPAWWWPTTIAGEVLALCVGAVLVALLLQRRGRQVTTEPTDAAFLP